MATLHVNSVILRCDGCSDALADGEFFSSATEARAAAYSAGWRFPAMVTTSGRPAQRGSDVCPVCLPSWRPALRAARPKYEYQDGARR